MKSHALMGSSWGWNLWWVLAFALTTVAALGDAEACTTRLPPAELKGYPADGEVNVPIDVVPFFDADAAWLSVNEGDLRAATITLKDASGDEIPVTVEAAYVTTFTVTPARELKPNTRYSIELLRPAGANSEALFETLTFQTGADRSAAPEAPSTAFLQHYELLDYVGGCAENWERGTCVAFPEGVSVVGTFSDDAGEEASTKYIWTEPAFVDLTGIEQGTPFTCVNLRTRAANGALSDATKLCGADAPFFGLGGYDGARCTPRGISFENRLVTEPAPSSAEASPAEGRGCSLVMNPAAPGGTAPWLLVLGAAALRIRRRNSAVSN